MDSNLDTNLINSEKNYSNLEKNSRTNSNNFQNNKDEKTNKKKVNYFSYTREIKKDINWDE